MAKAAIATIDSAPCQSARFKSAEMIGEDILAEIATKAKWAVGDSIPYPSMCLPRIRREHVSATLYRMEFLRSKFATSAGPICKNGRIARRDTSPADDPKKKKKKKTLRGAKSVGKWQARTPRRHPATVRQQLDEVRKAELVETPPPRFARSREFHFV